MTLIQDIVDLRVALIMTLPRCGVCGDFAAWEWSDEEGSETVCDKHKCEHFYAYGPEEIEYIREAFAVLERTA